jgi:hypothetical protein
MELPEFRVLREFRALLVYRDLQVSREPQALQVLRVRPELRDPLVLRASKGQPDLRDQQDPLVRRGKPDRKVRQVQPSPFWEVSQIHLSFLLQVIRVTATSSTVICMYGATIPIHGIMLGIFRVRQA